MLEQGSVLDRKYEVIRIIGQGGMGSVYLCKNINLDTLWAIKEVPKEAKSNVNFLAEPNILKKLKHPGIPRIIDIFYENDNLYMVEDYIEGENLKEYVKRKGSLNTEEICKLASEMGKIVEYLHSFAPPIIHRDLKPSNIMITPEDEVVLIDFGISRVYKPGQESDTVYIGSRGYAAPEQFYGTGQSSIQTDIYALGAVIYFMLTGKAPSTALEPLYDENYDENVNVDIREIIKKAMKIKVEERYGSIEEMSKEIHKVSEIEATILRTRLFLDKESVSKSTKEKHLRKTLLIFFLIIILIIIGTYSLVYSYQEGKANTKANVNNVNNIKESLDKNLEKIDLEESDIPAMENNTDEKNNIKTNEENNKEDNDDKEDENNDEKANKNKGKAKGKFKK
ncbi:serine/threonine protein kinase [Clostridium pascui]|uniref:serine/threonine-protein kinase n=1 Tax=Clostridium pascui TaxID=46609 RepID=UPI00195E43A1|nr:serine/threonine-protein kinase [Clostridium pascui]MBM7870370.1 serine/threonine protein kinase [Clostridium pascui]